MTEWIEWGKRLQAVAQNGLVHAANDYEVHRYAEIQRIAAEMMSRHSEAPVERVLDLFAGQTGEATPKVDVRGVVASASRIILVRERQDGRWSLPGGWADPGESPRAAVEREVLEETGCATRATRLVGVYDRTRRGEVPPAPFHVYKLVLVCEPLAPLDAVLGRAADHEIADVRLFGRDELPPLSLGRVAPSMIADVFAHLDDPALPATVD